MEDALTLRQDLISTSESLLAKLKIGGAGYVPDIANALLEGRDDELEATLDPAANNAVDPVAIAGVIGVVKATLEALKAALEARKESNGRRGIDKKSLEPKLKAILYDHKIPRSKADPLLTDLMALLS